MVRLADGTGTQTHERVQGLNDPVWLGAGFGLAAFLALTTLLGLLWRRGLRGGSRLGTLAAISAVAGAAGVWVMLGAAVATGLAAAQLGSEFLFDQPQPTMTAFLALADVGVVLAALVVLSLILAWRAPGWSLGRRLHHSVFALAMVGLAMLIIHWGLAFGGGIS